MSGLTIGDLSVRTGLAPSAIRFYETHGIITPLRNAGGHRRYGRADIRRLSFALAAQRLGLPLAQIGAALAGLPADRAPSRDDWAAIGTTLRARIAARITALQVLADRLDGCIGCGCLSMDTCALYNSDDWQGAAGPGPRALPGPEG